VRSLTVVVLHPRCDLGTGVVQAEEQRLVEQIVAHATVGAFDVAFCIGLPGAM